MVSQDHHQATVTVLEDPRLHLGRRFTKELPASFPWILESQETSDDDSEATKP